MYNGFVEDACYMLSDMAIYAYNMDCNHGNTQMERICKIIQVPKTWPYFLLLATFQLFVEHTVWK